MSSTHTVQDALSNAGRSFLRAFAASVIVYAPGILAATNLNESRALGIAALAASFTAGLRVLQDLVPSLQIRGRYGDHVGSFLRAFAGQFLVAVIGILDAPNVTADRAAVIAALTGALTAGFVAVQKYVAAKPVA